MRIVFIYSQMQEAIVLYINDIWISLVSGSDGNADH